MMMLCAPALAMASEEGPLAWASGDWGVGPEVSYHDSLNCDNSPNRIRVSPDHRELTSVHGTDPAVRARILSVSAHSLEIQYIDEQRQDASGQPLTWIMWFNDPDGFVWIRTDRHDPDAPMDRTHEHRRCPT